MVAARMVAIDRKNTGATFSGNAKASGPTGSETIARRRAPSAPMTQCHLRDRKVAAPFPPCPPHPPSPSLLPGLPCPCSFRWPACPKRPEHETMRKKLCSCGIPRARQRYCWCAPSYRRRLKARAQGQHRGGGGTFEKPHVRQFPDALQYMRACSPKSSTGPCHARRGEQEATRTFWKEQLAIGDGLIVWQQCSVLPRTHG